VLNKIRSKANEETYERIPYEMDAADTMKAQERLRHANAQSKRAATRQDTRRWPIVESLVCMNNKHTFIM
jgi:hypothetical protein